jgi:ribosomal protein S18 acetylase RimI-like enzyme
MDVETTRRTDRSDVGPAAHSLAAAFYDDPVLSFSWPDGRTRFRRAERYFASQLQALWDRRELHALPDLSSVAVWARPDEWQIPPRALLRIARTSLVTRVRVKALVAYLRTDALHPDEPHWYLEFLGTVPERQGEGLGARVLAPVLARADEEGVAIWTWSSNRKNLAFYHRHGFVVLEERPFTAGGPPIFPIRREPR